MIWQFCKIILVYIAHCHWSVFSFFWLRIHGWFMKTLEDKIDFCGPAGSSSVQVSIIWCYSMYATLCIYRNRNRLEVQCMYTYVDLAVFTVLAHSWFSMKFILYSAPVSMIGCWILLILYPSVMLFSSVSLSSSSSASACMQISADRDDAVQWMLKARCCWLAVPM